MAERHHNARPHDKRICRECGYRVKCGMQLTSRSWEVEGGYRRDGSIAKHEWKGLGKGGLNRLEDWVEREKQEQGIVEEY